MLGATLATASGLGARTVIRIALKQQLRQIAKATITCSEHAGFLGLSTGQGAGKAKHEGLREAYRNRSNKKEKRVEVQRIGACRQEQKLARRARRREKP